MNEKYGRMLEDIKQYGRVGVCLSGGSDSALVTIAAVQALGRENVIALTADTPFFTGEEMDISAHLCSVLGIPHKKPHVSLLSNDDVISNSPERCYYCKRIIMATIQETAKKYGLKALLDGSNATDIHDYRPGERALQEYNILSPLKAAGITKQEVYDILKELNMKDFIVPENACLATRIATGEPITIKKLRWIRAAENYLKQMGFGTVRVRVSDSHAKIQVGKEQIEDLMAMREEVETELKDMGYKTVEIDPEGYRKSGYCFGE